MHFFILNENGLTFIYILDKVVGFIYNKSRYYYQRNIQNNIVSIYREDGTLVCKYVYDSYGRHKVLDASGVEVTSTTFIGNINPYRYRGYCYDRVLGLYFLTNYSKVWERTAGILGGINRGNYYPFWNINNFIFW